jgi:hypothetical protein
MRNKNYGTLLIACVIVSFVISQRCSIGSNEDYDYLHGTGSETSCDSNFHPLPFATHTAGFFIFGLWAHNILKDKEED